VSNNRAGVSVPIDAPAGHVAVDVGEQVRGGERVDARLTTAPNFTTHGVGDVDDRRR
jgi:hypothetical protein